MALFACPECHSIDELLITVETVAHLIQDDPDDEYETETVESAHWWDGKSSVACDACSWSGLVKQLETLQLKES